MSGTTFGFTGQRFDAETGLYYYKRRYYSPIFGRFLQPDPVPTEHLYRYVHNDPLNLVDPTGEFGIVEFVIVVIILLLLLSGCSTNDGDGDSGDPVDSDPGGGGGGGGGGGPVQPWSPPETMPESGEVVPPDGFPPFKVNPNDPYAKERYVQWRDSWVQYNRTTGQRPIYTDPNTGLTYKWDPGTQQWRRFRIQDR